MQIFDLSLLANDPSEIIIEHENDVLLQVQFQLDMCQLI